MSNFSDPAPINYSFKDKVPIKRRLPIWQKITTFLLVLLVISSLIIIKLQSDQLNNYRNTIYSMQTQIATQQAENVLLQNQITTLESKINLLTTPTPKP